MAYSCRTGPGDPEPCDYAITAIKQFLEARVPIFGICLGHQLLGLATGARTIKMKFGHHGPTIRSSISTPVASTSRARTTALRSTRPRCPRVCAQLTVRCSMARCRASPAPIGPLSASRVTPRRVGSRATWSRCSAFRRIDAAQGAMPSASSSESGKHRSTAKPHRPREHPDHRRRPDRDRTRPASSTTRRPGCKALREEGYRVILVKLQSGDDHDRSGHGGRHLHRAGHWRTRGRASSRRSGRTRCCDDGGQTALIARSTSCARACWTSSASS